MPAIIILGLKLPFRALWEKVGIKELPTCSCPTTSDEYVYCPHCGVRKATKSVKVYKSRLTGEETTYRNVNAVMEYLHRKNLDLYDTNPRGYTDDPVYIYFTQPCCILQVSNSNPVTMDAIQKYPFELSDWLYEIVGDALWDSGEYGLWAFNTEQPEISKVVENSEPARSIIIPFGPH